MWDPISVDDNEEKPQNNKHATVLDSKKLDQTVGCCWMQVSWKRKDKSCDVFGLLGKSIEWLPISGFTWEELEK